MTPQEVDAFFAAKENATRVHPTIDEIVRPIDWWGICVTSHPNRYGGRMQQRFGMQWLCVAKNVEELASRLRSAWEFSIDTAPPFEVGEAEKKFIEDNYPEGVPWKTFEEAMAEAKEPAA